MRKKFFMKNLLLFLVPLLIPIIILGTLSIVITQRYLQEEVNKNNLNLFNQIDRNIELIFNEIDSLSISLGNTEVLYRIEDILQTQTLTLENLRLMKTSQNYINAPVIAKPYIESIYVYVNNEHNQFIANGVGLTTFSEFHDVSWRSSFKDNQNKTEVWTEPRQIQRYSFEAPISVTTVYKNLFSNVLYQPNGVIVLNIYTNYIENLLKNIVTYPDQHILVVDGNDQVIFKNRPLDKLENINLKDIMYANESFTLQNEGKAYLISQLHSSKYGWRYISITQGQSLTPVPFQLSTVTLSLVLLSFLLGLALTYYLTRRNVNHIRNIISIINYAERGIPLPSISPSSGVNEYDYITQKIVKNFIEQNYLQVQLSEKKYKLQAAELVALQSQINPHFLFNTLETIYWKVIGLTGQPNEANRMLEYLSDLLKYALDTPNKIVTLEKEINYTENYLSIQKIRYRNQFDVIWDYEEEDVERYSVVKLLLQPLIENSIYHGIKEKQGKSGIKIKITCFSAYIRIAVIDNGIGMSKARLEEVRRQMDFEGLASEHIGLVNTNKRIQLTYGSVYKIHIQSKQQWGTVVSVHIPM
ncbi:sensor histidine kinase [Paenibacillus agricola]|uniref:Histidine kinase n=1 Tax=Paenibacillus agricola TaxID=2716264 RepID=A0ABX0J1U4_9BACL|nr:sensor histidine kinase [Paenibacillus agricola]NHN30245.1 histidine kinase [Paenibacillus agricola]